MTLLKDLVVFQQLAVKDIRIEPKRVRAQYELTKKDGSVANNELIYAYDQAYFDPESAKDVNLASMMLAQIALNYGLFCQQIQLEGLFDQADKRFLTDMLENTSREILVNKFLLENPFLKAPYDQVEPQQRKRYTAAELIFSSEKYSQTPLLKELETPDLDRYAILSSGGKDSLLTYGLVKEFGEAHPVFINESGRHWFTAKMPISISCRTNPTLPNPGATATAYLTGCSGKCLLSRRTFKTYEPISIPFVSGPWPSFCLGCCPLRGNAKRVTSSSGMNTTLPSSLYIRELPTTMPSMTKVNILTMPSRGTTTKRAGICINIPS
jgi:hypothetical protein